MELDDAIQRAFLVLRLSETNSFSTLCPLDGGIVVTKLDEQGELYGFRFRFRDEQSGFYCRLEITKTDPQHRYEYRGKFVTRWMGPKSNFLRFGRDFYDDPIAELAKLHDQRVPGY